MALACGVKVIRFSIGFGKPLFRWTLKNSPTEFVICAFPVGGYVKMLDEREASVTANERHLAFNTQPLRSRVAIVAAGPFANLLLAVLLYAAVNWIGVEQATPILARPVAGSMAEQAGLRGGEKIARAGFEGGELQSVESFDELRWFLTRGAMEGQNVRLLLASPANKGQAEVLLKLATLDAGEVNADLFSKIGISSPYSRPVVGELLAGGAAEKAGLRPGDLVEKMGLAPVIDAQQLRQLIRDGVRNGEAVSQIWKINRDGITLEIEIMPDLRQEGAVWVGKIGAYVGAIPELVLVRYGALEGLWRGLTRTWDVSALTLKMMGKMLVGEASLNNLSGPLSIAEYAGKSASMGLTAYLGFLAMISVSLGVLNLLPLPVLDGGHLMYYLWECVVGKPVSESWMERLQRVGMVLLFAMMAIALFNDLSRLIG
jgi:regulator of sigma E protease